MSRTPPPPVQRREVVAFDPKAAYSAIESAINERRDAIVATLVPTIPPDRFISVALQAVTRSPRLLECTPASIIKSLRDAAELGLEPSGLMGSAYLVPYKNRGTQRYEAQLIPGYRGLIGLARRSGEVRTIEAHIVRERDEFEFRYGLDQYLRHKPWMNLTGEREERFDENNTSLGWSIIDAGQYVAVYAFARLTSGEVQFEVMSIPEVDAIRRRSKAADDGPWVTDYVEMARKTVVRRLLKYLPLSVADLTRALELEDVAEGASESATVRPNVARDRLVAALTKPREAAQDASGDAVEPDLDVDTADDDGDVPDAPLTASDDGGEQAADAPATCGDPSPYGDGETCEREPKHRTPHKSATATWPV